MSVLWRGIQHCLEVVISCAHHDGALSCADLLTPLDDGLQKGTDGMSRVLWVGAACMSPGAHIVAGTHLLQGCGNAAAAHQCEVSTSLHVQVVPDFETWPAECISVGRCMLTVLIAITLGNARMLAWALLLCVHFVLWCCCRRPATDRAPADLAGDPVSALAVGHMFPAST